MKGWSTGKILMQDQGKYDFEIFTYVKNGLQPHNNAMKPISPPGVESLEKQAVSYKRDMNNLEKKYNGFNGAIICIDEWGKKMHWNVDGIRDLDTIFYSDGSTKEARAGYESLKEALQKTEKGLQKYPSRPSWKDYELPKGSIAARSVIDSLLNSYFKLEDFFELKNQKKQGVEAQDPEIFIRSLQVSYVSDTEISIKVGDNKARNYTRKEMGFKSDENGWKLLMEVLKEGNHLFNVGLFSKDKIPEKIKYYNQRQKWITQFTKKFIAFINREYGAQISGKTKLFENQKKKNRDGLYKPMFQIAAKAADHSPGIVNMSKQALLKEMEILATNRRREIDPMVREDLLLRIGKCAEHAYECKWITREHLRKMISLPDEEISTDDAMSLVDKYADINNR
jgi:hypothetical protein